MKLSDLFSSAKKQATYLTRQKLNQLVKENYRFKNLDKKNRKLVIDLITKHSNNIRNGKGISSTVIQRETYRLYKDRIKLNLTKNDLDDIKKILNMFKK